VKFSFAAIFLFSLINIFPMAYIKFAEDRYLNFNERPQNVPQTVLLMLGTPKSELFKIGNLLNLELESFYIKDILNFKNIGCKKPQDIEILKKTLILIASCDFEKLKMLYDKSLANFDEKTCQNAAACSSRYHKHWINHKFELSCKPKNSYIEMLMKAPRSLLLSKMCQKHSLFIIEMETQCGFNLLQSAILEVTDKISKLKIIHFVEDPRSKVYQSIRENQNTSLKEKSQNICMQISRDIETGYELKNASPKFDYMVMRREEIESTIMRDVTMQRVRKFVGNLHHTNMACTLFNVEENKTSNREGWMFEWRRHLSIKKVKIIQDQCLTLFKNLSYVNVFYHEDLRDIQRIELFL